MGGSGTARTGSHSQRLVIVQGSLAQQATQTRSFLVLLQRFEQALLLKTKQFAQDQKRAQRQMMRVGEDGDPVLLLGNGGGDYGQEQLVQHPIQDAALTVALESEAKALLQSLEAALQQSTRSAPEAPLALTGTTYDATNTGFSTGHGAAQASSHFRMDRM